jgi:hypothetical protein
MDFGLMIGFIELFVTGREYTLLFTLSLQCHVFTAVDVPPPGSPTVPCLRGSLHNVLARRVENTVPLLQCSSCRG